MGRNYVSVAELHRLGWSTDDQRRLLVRFPEETRRDSHGQVFISTYAIHQGIQLSVPRTRHLQLSLLLGKLARHTASALKILSSSGHVGGVANPPSPGQPLKAKRKQSRKKRRQSEHDKRYAPVPLLRRPVQIASGLNPKKSYYFGPDARNIQGDWNPGEQPELPPRNGF